MPEVLYLDASAVVKLIVAEPESWALADRIGPEVRVTSSEVSRVEVLRVLRRVGLGETALRHGARVLSRIDLLRVDRVLLERAAGLEPVELRALDAIHLASALSLGDALGAFVTYDRQLARASERAGIRIESPGS